MFAKKQRERNIGALPYQRCSRTLWNHRNDQENPTEILGPQTHHYGNKVCSHVSAVPAQDAIAIINIKNTPESYAIEPNRLPTCINLSGLLGTPTQK